MFASIICDMKNTTVSPPNGYQVRTGATKALLLKAAEEVFIRDGFESAQLDTIARAANRTRGAIYAHYRSKEDLFLALYEHRSRFELSRLAELLKPCRNRKAAVRVWKKFLVGLTKDKTWPLLTLEFKLYSVRHPDSRKRLRKLSELVNSIGWEVLQHQLLADLSAGQQKQLELRGVAITPLISSLTLESYILPDQLSEKRLEALLNRFLDVILENISS
jgi:AcrR family transcriptional regulator